MPVIQTNEKNRIVIEQKEYKGNDYIDVRKQFLSEDGKMWLFTNKGLTVSPAEWKEIIEALTPMLEVEEPGGTSQRQDDIPF